MIKANSRADNGRYIGRREIRIPVIWVMVGVMVVIVIVLGLSLIASSVIFIEDQELKDITRGLGISIIGGAFIAWAVTYLIDRYNLEEIVGSMEDVRNSFKLIKGCEDNGLLKIYEPYDRHSPETDFTDDILEALKEEAKEIKICGLSLRLFFRGEEKFFEVMQKAFDRMGKDDKFEIKILMISPESPWKSQRQSVEDCFFTEGKLGDDLSKSIKSLKKTIENLENKNKDRIRDNIRFYDATPDFFLFITSRWIIFEIYHTGAFQLEKETNAVQCLGLGGHVPAFQFGAQSPMYNYLNAHFDYYFKKYLAAGEKLFSMDLKLEESLNRGDIVEEVKNNFGFEGVSLSGNATIVNEKTDEWVITDGENIYVVKKENEELNFYAGKRNKYHAGTLKERLNSKIGPAKNASPN